MSSVKTTILEVNLVSAQQLSEKKSSKMQTYVVAYIDSKKKHFSRVDKDGDGNPTWNDKFFFVIDRDSELFTSTSSMVLEIYKVRRFKKDKRIGSANVLLEDLMQKGCSSNNETLGHRFMAFHVRRSSGNPQGILNIGVVTLQQTFSRFLGSKTSLDYRNLS
ncbi:16 kDa phloem protein 1-like [Pistacia vera]|uniref:16 kDa phloem protein 1-like n=1 Tax=Pistacia vera TaxID=55513 RepID=UPI0012635C91|nr:16 kDa phloem protein 1-like [Pistacia vera]